MDDGQTTWLRQIMLKNQLLLTLRPAQSADAARVLAYVEQVAGESDNLAFGPGEFGISLEQEQVILQQFAEAPSSLYLLAEIEGEIAGTLTFTTEKRARLQHSGEFGVSVLQKYWNLGIGARLLEALIFWARETRVIRKINLRVHVDNLPAIHLYEKYGFQHEGCLRRAFYVGGRFIDVFMMGLLIDE